jgi:outer membrane protein TolC
VLFSAGKATRLDGLKAQAQSADAQRTLERAREAERLALALLRRVIGLAMEEPLDPGEALPSSLASPRDESELAALALQGNAELKRIDRQIEQARDTRQAARAARAPELAVQASYGYRERDIGGSAPEWIVGVVAAWTVYDGGATASQTAKASARLAQLQASRQVGELALQADIADAAGAWRSAGADADAAARLQAANEEALKAALSLYASGKATALDVLGAQSDLARAEGSRAQARAALAVARVRVARLTGIKDAAQLEQRP